MSRLVSFVVLVAVVLLVTALFFRVMLEFLVPMFLAAVLVVVFRPLHQWFQLKLAGHPRVSAAATTLAIVLIVLLPTTAIAWNAYLEIAAFAREALDVEEAVVVDETAADEAALEGEIPVDAAPDRETPDGDVPEDETPLDGTTLDGTEVDETAVDGSETADDVTGTDAEESGFDAKLDSFILAITGPLHERLGFDLPSEPDDPRIARIREQIKGAALENLSGQAGVAVVGAQWVLINLIRLIIGLVIMVISIYYFLADGPGMIVTIMRLSPLDDRYELELLDKFTNVSRAVVVATLLSAFVQGVLAGIGYYFAGIPAVFALTGLTMLLAVVPFLGAAAVWLPTSAWLLLAEERTVAAIVLAVYGAAVVSAIDNVIKPYVLHGQSNLHPLLALLSVLGGVAALGPIGILVGPMAVAFLQALLGMLRREIHEIGEGDGATAGRPVVRPGPPSQAGDAPSSATAAAQESPPAEPAGAPPRKGTQTTARQPREESTAGRARKRRKRS